MATGGKLNRLWKVLKRFLPCCSSSEDDRDTGNNAPKHGQIENNVSVECGLAAEEGKQSQPRDSDVRDTDQDPGTGTSGKLNWLWKVFSRFSSGRSPREDDQDTGNNAPKQGHIESNIPVECGLAAEEGEQSQPRDSDVRDTDQDPGTGTREATVCQPRDSDVRDTEQDPGTGTSEATASLNTKLSSQQQGTKQLKLITPVLKMNQGASSGGVPVTSTSVMDTEQQKLIAPVLKKGQGASSGGVPVTSTSGKDTGPSSVITELLAGCDDFQLLQLTDFYRDRLEQAMEGGVHGVSLALTAQNQFSGEEHRKISDLADKGERANSSKLLLCLVMEKGSRARRVMWETFVKMQNCVPNLDKILKEIQIYGCDPSHRLIPAQLLLEFLSELKEPQNPTTSLFLVCSFKIHISIWETRDPADARNLENYTQSAGGAQHVRQHLWMGINISAEVPSLGLLIPMFLEYQQAKKIESSAK